MPSSRATSDACSTMCSPSNVEVRPSKTMWSRISPVSDAVAEPRLREEVGRVRHRLHPARDDDLVAARADHQVGDLHRPYRRCAHLVDRVRRDLLRDSCCDGGLAGRRLTHSRLEHLPHDGYSTSPGSIPERSSPARIAIAPSSVAGSFASPPPRRPNGVRTAETMTDRVTGASVAPAQSVGPTLTSIFPTFSPRRRPTKAFGAFSMPSMTVSR